MVAKVEVKNIDNDNPDIMRKQNVGHELRCPSYLHECAGVPLYHRGGITSPGSPTTSTFRAMGFFPLSSVEVDSVTECMNPLQPTLAYGLVCIEVLARDRGSRNPSGDSPGPHDIVYIQLPIIDKKKNMDDTNHTFTGGYLITYRSGALRSLSLIHI